jgi:hypothetical protein
MMSPKNYSEEQIIDVVKKILDTRPDIKNNAYMQAKIINHILKNKSVKRTISALQEFPTDSELNDNAVNHMLNKIIKLLAVITRVIDNIALPPPSAEIY